MKRIILLCILSIAAIVVLSGCSTAKQNNFPIESKADAINYSLSLSDVKEILNKPLPEEFNAYNSYDWSSKAYKWPDSEKEWVVEWNKGQECNSYGCYLRFDVNGIVTLPFKCYGIATCK